MFNWDRGMDLEASMAEQRRWSALTSTKDAIKAQTESSLERLRARGYWPDRKQLNNMKASRGYHWYNYTWNAAYLDYITGFRGRELPHNDMEFSEVVGALDLSSSLVGFNHLAGFAMLRLEDQDEYERIKSEENALSSQKTAEAFEIKGTGAGHQFAKTRLYWFVSCGLLSFDPFRRNGREIQLGPVGTSLMLDVYYPLITLGPPARGAAKKR